MNRNTDNRLVDVDFLVAAVVVVAAAFCFILHVQKLHLLSPLLLLLSTVLAVLLTVERNIPI